MAPTARYLGRTGAGPRRRLLDLGSALTAWLVSQQRYRCALEILARLHGSAAAKEEIRVIRESVKGEVCVIEDTAATWADVFRGPVLCVTLLGTGVHICQQATGMNRIFSYATQAFQESWNYRSEARELDHRRY
ncbi:hypothetical protein HD806DRAFT_533324 [Xylariaceae sp. AK1471]|nr:hypothetical protein HD806DRAFT_533324 [Xylariaceae sp. AK1471]